MRQCVEVLERQVARQDEKAVRASAMQVRLPTAQPVEHCAAAERGAAATRATANAARMYLRFMP